MKSWTRWPLLTDGMDRMYQMLGSFGELQIETLKCVVVLSTTPHLLVYLVDKEWDHLQGKGGSMVVHHHKNYYIIS